MNSDPEYRNSSRDFSGSRRTSEEEYNIRDGILLIDKPSGLTSHDIVDLVRNRFRFKKVGHAGTLDPQASGLLILLLGRFTKESARFSGLNKEYEAVLCLGVSTDTADSEGRVVETRNLNPDKVSSEEIEGVFQSFRGEIKQVPPMYSAKKINGKKLYELARKGKIIKREPRVVTIEDIKILDISLPHVTFYVRCSKGTYIRQLGCDIGEKLGCGAHLVRLRRMKIGPFSVRDAIRLQKLGNEKGIHENILRPE